MVTGKENCRKLIWYRRMRAEISAVYARPYGDTKTLSTGRYIHPELFGHEGEPSIAEIHHPRPQ